MRKYINLDIEHALPFDYNLERVINDFILLAVFVGNDFLPNLLDLSGTINTGRLQIVLDETGQWEQEIFEKEYADMNWYKGKQMTQVNEMDMG